MNTNIVKETAKELGMTYKELAEAIGYGDDAVKKSAASGTVSTPMLKAIELVKKNKELQKEITDAHLLKDILKKFIS